ncbi:uncharacterized protein P174DRAFT_372772 [Aspergillus novofumigatus IBT 16806]|uniref:S-adenosyl-L-methionine-dependent methyltransferase n=1 Tax=Aspergillus novofumigatus (strain IBT 16806) TaxID=1392255 RepID=A0A2I1C6A4_ASPN1|nr:uncharacterized protein P174DRAFT_372772 [Aspergillus novofumigatus IBT 16806]PKX93157.1 hypothetical protein P174DRAFT_372772 [Aspergillus novofumigatus IBT 16806]
MGNPISLFLKGLVFPLKFIVNILARVTDFLEGKELYGLDHAILSVEVPPARGMWMNMGYWKHTSHFPEACEALLEQVLITAKLLNEDRTPITFDADNNTKSESFLQEMKLVDVGMGCGDQSLYLTRQLFRTTDIPTASKCSMQEAHSLRPLFDSYVGLTVVNSQADFARDRLSQVRSITDLEGTTQETTDVKIFAANAADPSSWESSLKRAIFGQSVKGEPIQECMKKTHTWLLALDTLYHFQPSRDRLFKCAYQDMQASIMAFDLLLSDQATPWERFVLRLMCLVAGMPYGNFVTKTGYKRILTQAGYESTLIEMRDISEHVFPGIANFLRKQDAELSKYGMTIGRYKGAANAFDWWGQTGVVRGVIVVARGQRT